MNIQLNSIITGLAHRLKLSPPSSLEDPHFAYKCFNRIMSSLDEGWQTIKCQPTQSEHQWIALIQVLQEKVLEEDILSENQQIGLPQIVKVYYVMNELVKNIKPKPNTINNDYLKFIDKRHHQLNKKYKDKELSYYMKLRDQKVQYIKQIHRVMEQLQKQKYEEMQASQLAQQQQNNQNFQNNLNRINQQYEQCMKTLKTNIKIRKQFQKKNQIKEMNLCRAMDKAITKKKQQQMEALTRIYEAERQKLHAIIGDEEKLKNRLLALHDKYCS